MSTLKVNELQHTNGTSALEIDSTGRVTQPVKPSIAVDGSNANTVTQTAGAVVTPGSLSSTGNSEVSFEQGGMTYNTSNGQIHIPVSGVYMFYGQLYTNAAHTARIRLYVNGVARLLGHHDNDANVHTVSVSGLLKLDANDKVTFVSQYASDIYFGSQHTFYFGYLVG